MAHLWDRGVLDSSSWHGLEEVGTFTDDESMIGHGERCGAWPTGLRREPLFTAAKLAATKDAIVGSYSAHPERVIGVVGDRYRATAVNEWRDLVKAAVKAGAKPTGAFSLSDGAKVLATFEVGTSNGLRTQFLLVDSFDGSLSLTAGGCTTRTVCANTMAVARREGKGSMGNLRHTAALEGKVRILEESIGRAILTGQKVKDLFNAAAGSVLPRDAAKKAFDLLFPEAPKDATAATKTKADNRRTEAMRAAALPVNVAGTTKGNLGTLWNAATYLVDRNVNGTTRASRGDALESMLFGSRSERIEEIQAVIEAVMADGTIQKLDVTDARKHGIDDKQIGRALLADMLA